MVFIVKSCNGIYKDICLFFGKLRREVLGI